MCRVTLGDGVFTKSLMKMIYRKLSKTASLPVTCHPGSVALDNDFPVSMVYRAIFLRDRGPAAITGRLFQRAWSRPPQLAGLVNFHHRAEPVLERRHHSGL